MARPKTTIHAEVAPITGGGTEADMMCWVRVTEMLLRARMRRKAQLDSEGTEEVMGNPQPEQNNYDASEIT